MTVQLITPELKSWIVAQATAGHPPDIVLDAMKASG
jgi:prolyl 4-hydroxylase